MAAPWGMRGHVGGSVLGPAYAPRVLGEALRRRAAWRRVPGWLRRFAGIGALPSDSEETRLRTSAAVALWGLTSPVGALLFIGARQAVPWFLAFAALVAGSAAIDPTLAAGAPDIPNGVVVTFFALNVLGVSTTVYVLLQYFVRARVRALADSERLLLNVLSAPVACRLKQSEQVIADGYAAATVLF